MTIAPESPTPRFVRADGPDKVTGTGRYAADLTLTGQLFAKFRYAGVPHGRITKLDTSAAKAIPGVFAVLTQDDVPDLRYGDGIKDRTLFAKDVVRYEAEIVAAVAAVSAEVAQAAVDAIVLEIEPLPAVVDLEAALAPDAPLVHEDWESYENPWECIRDRNDASYSSLQKGDVDAGMAEADHVVTGRYLADGSHAAPIEPRGIVRIDGVDVCDMGLQDLRDRIAVVPQEAALFGGSLRRNLDPFNRYPDAMLWSALETVQLKDKVEHLPGKLYAEMVDYGSNFSLGERFESF